MRRNIGELLIAFSFVVSAILLVFGFWRNVYFLGSTLPFQETSLYFFIMMIAKLVTLLKVKERSQKYMIIALVLGLINIYFGDYIGGVSILLGGLISWYDLYDIGF